MTIQVRFYVAMGISIDFYKSEVGPVTMSLLSSNLGRRDSKKGKHKVGLSGKALLVKYSLWVIQRSKYFAIKMHSDDA